MLHPSILTDLFGLALVAIGLRRQYGPGFLRSYGLENHKNTLCPMVLFIS